MIGSDVLENASFDTIEFDRSQVIGSNVCKNNVKAGKNSEQKNSKPKKRHICELCNKEFTKKCGLSTHLLIHAGVKPFVCEICNKTFTKKCTLTVHLLTHSSEKPFVCEICDKAFARKTDLQKHNFVHSGEKRYICDICKTGFTHQNNLRRHKLKHYAKECALTKQKDVLSSVLVDNEKNKQDQPPDSFSVGIKKPESLQDSTKKLIVIKDQCTPKTNAPENLPNSISLANKEDITFGGNEAVSSPIQSNAMKIKNPLPIFVNLNLQKPVQDQLNGTVLKNNSIRSPNQVFSELSIKPLNQSKQKAIPLIPFNDLKDSTTNHKDKTDEQEPSSIFLKLSQLNKSVKKDAINSELNKSMSAHSTTSTAELVNYEVLNLEKSSELLKEKEYVPEFKGTLANTNKKLLNQVLMDTGKINAFNSVPCDTNSCEQSVKVLKFNEVCDFKMAQESLLTDVVKCCGTEIEKKIEPCGILTNIGLTPHTNIDIDKLIQINDSILKGVVNLSENFVESNNGSINDKTFNEASMKTITTSLEENEGTSEKSCNDVDDPSIFNNILLDTTSNIDIDKLIKFNESVIMKETANLNDSLKSLHAEIIELDDICNDSKVITQNPAFSLESPSINFPDSNKILPDTEMNVSEVISNMNLSSSVIDISKLIKLNNSVLLKETASISDNSSSQTLNETSDDYPLCNLQNETEENSKDLSSRSNTVNTNGANHSSTDINTVIKLNKSLMLKEVANFKTSVAMTSDFTSCKDVLDVDSLILDFSKESTDVICKASLMSNSVMSDTALPVYPVIHLEEKNNEENSMNSTSNLHKQDFSNVGSEVSSAEFNFQEIQEPSTIDTSVLPVEKNIAGLPIPMYVISKENLKSVNDFNSSENDNSTSIKTTTKDKCLAPASSSVSEDKHQNIQKPLYEATLQNKIPKVIQETTPSNLPLLLQSKESSQLQLTAFDMTNLKNATKTLKQNDAGAPLLNVKSIRIPVLCLDECSKKGLLNCKLPNIKGIEDSLGQNSKNKITGLKSKILVLTAPLQSVSNSSSNLLGLPKSPETANEKNKFQLVGNILPLLPGKKTGPIKTVSSSNLIKQHAASVEKNKLNLVGSIFPLLSGIKSSPRKEIDPSLILDLKETGKKSNGVSVFQNQSNGMKSLNGESGNIKETRANQEVVLLSEKTDSNNSTLECFPQNSSQDQEINIQKMEEECLSEMQELYSCDNCGRIFEDKDVLSAHSLSHTDCNCYQCYLCDETFENSNLLHMHVLTHSDDTIEDMDVLSLDGELDSAKFGPLTPGDISLDEIDKLDFEEDFDEKVARMYALAHVEGVDSDTDDSYDDEATKVYALSQVDFSVNEKDRNQTKKCQTTKQVKSKGGFKSPSKVYNNKDFHADQLNNNYRSATKVQCKTTINVSSDDAACDGFSDSKMSESKLPSVNSSDVKNSLNMISKLRSKISTHLQKKSDESYDSSDDMLDIDLSDNEEIYSKEDFKELELINSDLSEGSVFSPRVNLKDNLNGIHNMNEVQTLRDNLQKNLTDKSNDCKIKPNIKLHSSKPTDKRKRNYVCHICDKKFMRKQFLQTHYLMHAGIKPYICEICYKTFTKKCSLTIHSLIHTGEKKHSCRECKKTFGRKTDLQKHTLIHSGHKPYKCDVCHKGFNHQNNLRRHKLIHMNKKLHVCDICSQRFSERVNLLTHMKIHIKEAEINELNGFSNSNISNHLRSIKEKLHACDHCGMLFARRDRLLKHKATHIVRTSHPCEVCGSAFKNRDQLQIHLLNHIDIAFDDIEDNADSLEDLDLIKLEPSMEKVKKTYACNQCFKVYTRHSALKCHYLTHTGERPHECHICKKRFAQRTTLKRHILAHSGIKPYKCAVCDKAFAREPSLRKHYVTHTTNKVVC